MKAAVAQMDQTQWLAADDLAPCGLPATASAPAHLSPQTEPAQRLGATMSDGPRLDRLAAGQRPLGATKSEPAVGAAAARRVQAARAELAKSLRRAPCFQGMAASASDGEVLDALVRTVSGRRSGAPRPAADDAPSGKRMRLQEPLLEAVPPHEQVRSGAVGGDDPDAAAAVDAIARAALGEADGDDMPDADQ